MNSQPFANVAGTAGSSRSGQKSATSTRRSNNSSNNNLPNPYQNARRKRAATRKKRRFDAVMARLPKPPNLRLRAQSIVIPAVLQPTPWSLSKILSILLLLGALMSFSLLHMDEQWFVYREDVRFNDLIRMRGDDLYTLMNLEGLNVFWVEPETIRAALLELPWVEDAQVSIALPADITIDVTEMTPAAVWVTNEGNYWLAMNGAALPVATLEESALPELALPQIVDSLQEARVVGDGPLAIDVQVLNSALTVMAAMPELGSSVRYNESIGLNFPLPDPAIWVYWGNGFDLDAKLENLALAREMVRKAEEPRHIVDVRLVDRPYVR
jgi:cell division septal protein FtsQ